jgi:hypothetical protein
VPAIMPPTTECLLLLLALLRAAVCARTELGGLHHVHERVA